MRNSGLRRLATVLLSLASILPSACTRIPDQTESHRQWAVYGGDALGSKYSELDQIDRSNVSELEVAWIYRVDDSSDRPSSTIECNPIIIDGVMYVVSPALKVIALDAAQGTEIWRFDPAVGRGVSRGVTYWEDGEEKTIFFVAGPYLFSLNARTGLVRSGFGDGGRLDLQQGLDREGSQLHVTSTSPGIVFQDVIIMGSSVGEGPGPAAPGHIRAFDVRTGAQRWIFHTIPHPGEDGYETWPEDAWRNVGGANSWGGLTLDRSRGLVFLGTGSPSYDHWGGDRIGQNLFGNCILALDALTGERRWHFQVVHHDIWDYDIPCPPNLVTIVINGKRVDAVAQPTKMGHLFVLDRETGQPLFPVEERPVPPSEVPGEATWPTQPFPLIPPPYAQQVLTEEQVSDLSSEVFKEGVERLKSLDTGSIFLPPSFRGAVTLPQFNGGTDWGGAAFDPETGTLYVNASNEAEWISMVNSTTSAQLTVFERGARIFDSSCSACHAQESNKAVPSRETLSSGKTEDQLMDVIRSGRGQMPGFDYLTVAELESVVAFLQGKGHEVPAVTSEARQETEPSIPYLATGHHPLRNSQGYPLNRGPWGTLNAIDLNRGQILWQVPLGTYPELEAKGLPPTGTFNMGGAAVTAGGLVFIGSTMDERFRAFDKASGEMLWSFQLDAGAYATPAVYEVGGRQFVVVAAGGGGKPETRSGDAYYCFSLPLR